jgi:hypothetical protein
VTDAEKLLAEIEKREKEVTEEIDVLKAEFDRMKKVTDVVCCFCGVILDEDDVCHTKAGPACESCGDRHYTYDHGASKWPD